MADVPMTREVRIEHLDGGGAASRFRVVSRDGEIEVVTGFTALSRRIIDELADAHASGYVLTYQYVPQLAARALRGATATALVRATPVKTASALTRPAVVEPEVIHIESPAPDPPDPPEGSLRSFFAECGDLVQLFKDLKDRDR